MKNSYAVITEPCIGNKEGACVQVCPIECIYEGDDQFFIHPDECVICGACIAVCPSGAIFANDDVPLEWTGFIAKAQTYFAL